MDPVSGCLFSSQPYAVEESSRSSNSGADNAVASIPVRRERLATSPIVVERNVNDPGSLRHRFATPSFAEIEQLASVPCLQDDQGKGLSRSPR